MSIHSLGYSRQHLSALPLSLRSEKNSKHFIFSIAFLYHVSEKCRHFNLAVRRSLSPSASLPLLYPAFSAPVSMFRSSSGRSCARSRQSSSSLGGDASLFGGNIKSSLQGGVLNSSLSCGTINSSALFSLLHPI